MIEVANLVAVSLFKSASNIFNVEYPKLTDKNTIGEIFGLNSTSKVKLENAIYFVNSIDDRFKLEVYNELYENIKLNNLTSAPEMLKLQKELMKLGERDTIWDGILAGILQGLVNADCEKIIN